MLELVDVLHAVSEAEAEVAIDGRYAYGILRALRDAFPAEFTLPLLGRAIISPDATDWAALREEVTLGVNALIVAELKRRDLRAAQAQQAARRPRRSRAGDDVRAKALELAEEVRSSRPALSTAAVARLVLDRLAKDGLPPPHPTTIRNWLREK